MRITLFYVCVYDGNVISIIVMMCTHPMYGMHTAELEEQSRQSTPIYAIGTVTYPRMRGGSGVLEQVGYFGHDDCLVLAFLNSKKKACINR